MMFPKPQHKKIRKKKLPPLFELDFCWACYWRYGEYNNRTLERHHIYGGDPDRQHSENNGLYVDLCHNDHENVTEERDQELISYLQEEGQRRYEAKYSRSEFIRIFARNYL